MTRPVTPPLHLPPLYVVYSCTVFVLIGAHSYPPVGISGALGQIFYLRTTPIDPRVVLDPP